MAAVHDIHVGEERLDAGLTLPRHRHMHAYAAIILDGGYRETGNIGRVCVTPGDVVVHESFSAHSDEIGGTGGLTLNLPLHWDMNTGVYRPEELDDIICLARHSIPEATRNLSDRLATAMPTRRAYADDLPDRILAALNTEPDRQLCELADHLGVCPTSMSKAFRRAYGLSPKAYRAEARTRATWRRIVSTNTPLARLAVECGYADQAHMTRSITSLTQASPSQWRAASGFKTGPA